MTVDKSAVRRTAMVPLLIMATMIMVGNVVRGGFGTVQEAAKLDMGLSDLRLGLVQGLALSIPVALLSVPFGRAVDRLNRLRLMIAMGVLWSAGAILTAFAHSFWMLFIARMAAGLGTTCGVPAAISLAADLCAPDKRGRAMLMLTIGQWAGAALAFALGGALFGYFQHNGNLVGIAPWRNVNLALGLLSAFLILLMLLMREPARHEQGEGADAPFGVVAKELWGMRRFLIPLFVGQAGAVMADAAAGIWVAPVLTRTFHLQPDQFGGWVGAIIFGSGVGGSILGGVLADWGQRSGRQGSILLPAFVASILAVPAALFPLAPGTTSFGLLLALMLTSGTLMGVVVATAITVLLPNEVRGLCMGAFIAIAGVVGFGLAPTLVTWIADVLGGSTHLGTGLGIVGLGVGLMSVASFWIAMRNAPAVR